ncbi:Protein of unknown function DUF1641 [Moorella glycerini]|uniref:DUF1641 domain-containing protein n=1 Tax=Neomoorella stamsii TaxID=1266720 RepID=A0A9X7P779_9FIRM|nr:MULTISPECIES: DUF1641 domain-containing protein [Moorella]PRR76346.1 hypothetical protein MOST_05130 [Moorella stamsii]CEP67085.1 Protein of unknown function DUF1641 [Moorella glycerini]
MAQPARKIVGSTSMEPELSERSREILGLISAGIDSLEPSVIQNMVANLVRLGEVVDEFNRPEMLDLFREVAQTSSNLRSLIAELRELQETGTMTALLEFGRMIQAIKDSLTAGVVTGILQQAVNAVSMLDQMQTLQGDRLVTGMIAAMQEAVRENKDKSPQGVLSLLRQLNNPEARKGLGIFASFLQKLPAQLGFTN